MITRACYKVTISGTLFNNSLQGSTFWYTVQQIVTRDRCGLLQGNNVWYTIQQFVTSDRSGLLQGNNSRYTIQQIATSDRCDLLYKVTFSGTLFKIRLK